MKWILYQAGVWGKIADLDEGSPESYSNPVTGMVLGLN